MELNKEEIEYIINLLELDGRIAHSHIKKAADYGRDIPRLKERFNFVIGIIDKLRAIE